MTHEEQPTPSPNTGFSAHDAFSAFVQDRKAIGIDRYGTALGPNNGRNSLRDALEEVADLGAYLTNFQHELEAGGILVAVNPLLLAEAVKVRLAVGGVWRKDVPKDYVRATHILGVLLQHFEQVSDTDMFTLADELTRAQSDALKAGELALANAQSQMRVEDVLALNTALGHLRKVVEVVTPMEASL